VHCALFTTQNELQTIQRAEAMHLLDGNNKDGDHLYGPAYSAVRVTGLQYSNIYFKCF